ncbi:hypothetical protein PF005_g5681 [Phytophthora fragariae]|uniref:Uncharacterized protein n=1 Tax=Phytophthora fragariae TaxID=53985 RepID=A0A6A3QW92_9STRA|nr:hypothetical protein PF003_g30041 [Phytophthora fragariae]KAE8935727.1 hypothetical protein PF009_g14338 [Phytophthora fragariae]KAE8985535.1 hypothetical protein PF011_g20351 [Phytophthora fragariae]KAE9083822.1 hypothetical protein PF007_g21751 [Phytophthora fragariae]KAE9087666.1 hypothetical protein PF010_g19645 [Phytophthora fragariae]
MPKNEKITFFARFLWKSHHVHNGGKTSWRLHVYDATQEQTFEELMKIYHDVYDANKASVDCDLATVSIWGDWDGNCPESGDIMKFIRFSGLQTYQGDCLQFSTKPKDMEF